MNKGFTLIELLAVIIIIAIIAMISVPTVFDIISSSKEKVYEQQVTAIESAAKRWAIEGLWGTDNSYKSICFLKKGGYLENRDIVDPRNNEKMDGCVKIAFDSEYNQYTYTYQECPANENITCQ